jgi:hypothetical protein
MSLVIATESFACGGPDGAQYTVAAGQTYTTDHPVYAGREHLFRPAEEMATGGRALPEDHLTRPARTSAGAEETAVATPGVRRTRTVPPK